LKNATISTFIIRQPATGPPRAYWAVSNVEEYEGVSAVVMQKMLGPPTGNELGTQKYLASMIGEGILTTNLTDVL
jgi:hypothetical protein